MNFILTTRKREKEEGIGDGVLGREGERREKEWREDAS